MPKLRIARQKDLNCCRVVFIESTVSISLEKAFNRVSTMNSF